LDPDLRGGKWVNIRGGVRDQGVEMGRFRNIRWEELDLDLVFCSEDGLYFTAKFLHSAPLTV